MFVHVLFVVTPPAKDTHSPQFGLHPQSSELGLLFHTCTIRLLTNPFFTIFLTVYFGALFDAFLTVYFGTLVAACFTVCFGKLSFVEAPTIFN